MGLGTVIVDDRCVYREGLRSILSRDPSITGIEEAATAEKLQVILATTHIDAVIINQLLIPDISISPGIRVIIIASKPDRHVLLALSEHGLSGYFLDKPDIDEDLLRKALHLNNGCCLLDPELTLWALHPEMNGMEDGQDIHLTACEQEILALRKQGLTTSQIAQRRSISRTTVKKHLQNAARKLKKM